MEYLYEFSISSQVTGAIILLFWCFSRISKNALDMCFSSVSCVDRDEDGNCIVKKEVLQSNVKKIFQNIWAFICIVLGYFTSIFTSNEGADLCIIIFLTLVLISMGKFISYVASKLWFKEDYITTPEELDKYDVVMPMTEEEIMEAISNNE